MCVEKKQRIASDTGNGVVTEYVELNVVNFFNADW